LLYMRCSILRKRDGKVLLFNIEATLKATLLDTGWSLPRTRYGAGMTDHVAFII